MESDDEVASITTEDSDDEIASITTGDSDDKKESNGGRDFDDFDDSDDLSSSHHDQYGRRSQNYTILNEDDIRKCQDNTITTISTVLSISRDAAGVLLRHHDWNVSKVNDKWFADEEKVRKTVGLLESHVPLPDDKELTCGICCETYPRDRMSATDCGHPFCVICWQGYIDTAINDGPGCLMLRCPDPSCGAAVGQEMVNKIASNEGREKYKRYFWRSFVEDNTMMKWCPAPGCNYAVSFRFGGGTYDVSCRCSHSFCWNCVEEAHRPVDCGTASKWIMKNSAESGNMNWLCPDTMSEHGQGTGGFSTCNRYEAAKRGGYDDAKNSLERYTHYYERWATNQSSMQRAVENVNQMQTVHLKKLSEKQVQPVSQLQFIIEAWLQIVECRRVLKWTYAYRYYLPEEHAKKQFFEYLQGEAESRLELLHQCAEKEFQGFLNSEGPSNDFHEFRTKLAGLTSVTNNYFENLVRALANGEFDVDSHAPS